ncbi:MAG: flagellar biosynthesis protein FlhB [Pirellulales bacterium]
MAEQQGDRTEDATPHRRREAREQGQVAKSQDLSSAALLLGALGLLLFFGQAMAGRMHELFLAYLGGEPWLAVDQMFVANQAYGVTEELGRMLLPFFGMMFVIGALSNVMQVGFLFLPSRLAPDLSRINPIAGFARVFSIAGFARLGFGVFKIIIIAAVAMLALFARKEEILAMAVLDIPQIAAFMVELLLWTSIKIAVALFILALLDYAFQRWKHEQDLKMSHQQLREEMKNLQGDPQIIARRRAVQRQLVLNRLSSAVPKADVVVTNPTELAIAIQYDFDTMAAPIVVAKGAGVIAQRIRQLALENGIPIVERKPLARALYKQIDVGAPVPNEQYAAVAEVLAYVYQLKGKPLPKR